MTEENKGILVRSVRLENAEIDALMDKLDARSDESTLAQRAKHRFSYRVRTCRVRMIQPGSGALVTYIAPTRDLSCNGVSIFHGCYIHPGTKCAVQLISSLGNFEDIPGQVVRCEHVEGLIHDVGIRFDRNVEIAMYCQDAIKARVLLVEDDELAIPLAENYLKRLNAEVTTATTGAQAIEFAMNNIYDLVLLDMGLPDMDGFEVTKALREKGYSGKIVASTAMTAPEDRQRCLDAGCDDYLPKPYKPEQFASVIRSLHKEPLFSSITNDPTIVELVNAFVAALPQKVHKIEKAAADADNETLKSVAREIKGAAGGFGFEPITEAAEKLETALIKSEPIEKITSQVRELIEWCNLARASSQN